MTSASGPAEDLAGNARGERWWPVATAVVVASVLHATLPEQLRIQTSFWLPWLVVGILIALIVGDPGRIDRRHSWVRVLTDVLIALITIANSYAVIMLVIGIVDNAVFTEPKELLLAGGSVWLTNVIAFSLWYWDLDRGGAAERAYGSGKAPAFIFPEMTHTDHVPAGWTPRYVDYLAFSFATATAFSPTDVSAVKPWAKMLVVCEALLSLILAALVIARAINILQ